MFLDVVFYVHRDYQLFPVKVQSNSKSKTCRVFDIVCPDIHENCIILIFIVQIGRGGNDYKLDVELLPHLT